jgi:hypothetical protein
MKQSAPVWFVVAVAAVGSLCACGADDPSRVGRPPIVSAYAPGARQLTAFIGDTLSFRLDAFDPDQDRLATSFLLDGGVAASTPRWDYVVEDTGLVTVRGSVTDGEHSSFIEWTVSRLRQINLAPVIDAILPLEPSPVLVIGNRMDFAIRATDPESMPLSYSFAVDDSVVVEDRQFSYQATSVGWKSVRAIVSDGEKSAAREWSLRVTEIPDTIAPARVDVTRAISGELPGEIVIDWVAVGRDSMVGLASGYQVRTSPDPILNEADWGRGSLRPGIPAPLPPGQAMTMVVGGLLPARLTHVAVRAFDDFGNYSRLGSAPSVWIRGMSFSGRVTDAVSGAGVAAASLLLGMAETFTDSLGSYRFRELGPMTSPMTVRDESAPEVGAYFDYQTSYTVVHDDVVPYYLMPNVDLDTELYTDFLKFFRAMTDVPGNPFGAQQRRWELPINLYVRPYTRNGLDYGATIERVAREFDSLLGVQVFNLVAARPSGGVETVYRDGVGQDHYTLSEFTSDWYPRQGVIEFRTVYTPTTEDVLARTARHELGHALGLNHSLDASHLMVGGSAAPTADDFTPDELAVIRCLYTLPRGWDNRLFVRD